MRVLIRTLLIWLLVLAVPAQGMAAVTMAFCGPNHHAGPATTVAQHGATDDKHAHHPMSPQADHDDASAGVAQPADHDHDGVHGDKAKCSACASCCSLSAMLSPLLAVPAADVAATVFGAVVPSVDAFAVDGPERPPRSVLA